MALKAVAVSANAYHVTGPPLFLSKKNPTYDFHFLCLTFVEGTVTTYVKGLYFDAAPRSSQT